jgi:adenosine deaminase
MRGLARLIFGTMRERRSAAAVLWCRNRTESMGPAGPHGSRPTPVGRIAAGFEKEVDAMTDGMHSFIEGMPKAELHLHIEGTLEPELKFELAERNGLSLPYASAAEMRAAYDFDSLSTFLVGYYEGMGVLQTEQDFHDLGMAYFRKAASQNVRYAETFFDPQGHTSRGVDIGVVIEGLLSAQAEARETLGLRNQLILCFLRDMSAESAMETLEASAPWKDRIVGVGLDSDERNNPPVKFMEVFARARDMGYRLTMHCDVDQENSVAHIRQAIDEVGVERIDHGVNTLDDDALASELAEREMGFTVCPISNGFVVGGLRAEELKKMLDLGMRPTVNSDDPAYFNGYVLENLVAVQEAVDLSKDELVQLERNAFTISWLDDGDRNAYLNELDEYAGAAE